MPAAGEYARYASHLRSQRDGALQSGRRARATVQAALLVVQAAPCPSSWLRGGRAVRAIAAQRPRHRRRTRLPDRYQVLATLDLQWSTYDSTARNELTRRVVDRLSALPGVRAVSYEGLPPFQWGHAVSALSFLGQDSRHERPTSHLRELRRFWTARCEGTPPSERRIIAGVPIAPTLATGSRRQRDDGGPVVAWSRPDRTVPADLDGAMQQPGRAAETSLRRRRSWATGSTKAVTEDPGRLLL